MPLPSGRQRSLLALLLLGGGVPLSRDRLIDELWEERLPASAVSALHVHLSKLRGLLVLEAAGYALRPGGFEVDVWRFDALVEQARADGGQAGPLLGEALGLFRGDPLCDVASEGSVAQWRRALEEKRLQAILLRLDANLAAGAAGELVAELERLAGEHPFEERLWGQLMLALYRSGRQADALEVYQRARRLFAGELGLEPGELLMRLQQRILERDPTLLPQAQASAVAARAASNLPRPLTRLVGREREVAALAAFLNYRPSAKAWNRRLAARAAEIGDQQALVMATGNLFGQALNARDRDEMRRLRPELLALITPETSIKALGWIHYFLALDAYVDGQLESACEHASLSAEKAEAIGHEFMLASASRTRLLTQSARDGVIAHAALAEALELMRRPSVQPLAAFALWLVARYAAGVAPEAAGRWLAHAERILAELDSELWPESVLRDETMAVLGINDLGPLLDSTPPLDHAAALADAAAWLAERDPAEEVPREMAQHFSSAAS